MLPGPQAWTEQAGVLLGPLQAGVLDRPSSFAPAAPSCAGGQETPFEHMGRPPWGPRSCESSLTPSLPCHQPH